MDWDGLSTWQDFDWPPDDSHGFAAATAHGAPDAPSGNDSIREPLNEPNIPGFGDASDATPVNALGRIPDGVAERAVAVD